MTGKVILAAWTEVEDGGAGRPMVSTRRLRPPVVVVMMALVVVLVAVVRFLAVSLTGGTGVCAADAELATSHRGISGAERQRVADAMAAGR